MRQLEREMMLQLIDQRWREHLSEMDYLREGISLRAMGQRDPLVEWQRDGYEMFGQLMSSIDDDYVKYVMHAQVQVMARPALEPGLAGAQYLAAENPVLGAQAIAGALAAGPAPGEEIVFEGNGQVAALQDGDVSGRGDGAAGRDGGRGEGARGGAALAAMSAAAAGAARHPQGSEFDHVGRNDPCPCGSGKKFKFCHGK